MSEYSARFAWLDAITEGLEGGLANHPLDPGGSTAAGISRRSYPLEEPWPPSRERAQYIRHRDFWMRQRCDELPELVAVGIYDWSIHAGCGRAAEALQGHIGVKVDGDIGPRTIEACTARCQNLEQELDLAYALLRARAAHLAAISDQTRNEFLAGWWHRTLAIADTLCRAYVRAIDSRPFLAGEGGGEMTAPVTGGEARPASTPVQGTVRGWIRVPVALAVGWVAAHAPWLIGSENVVGVTDSVTLGLSTVAFGLLEGLGKIARDRGWPLIGRVI